MDKLCKNCAHWGKYNKEDQYYAGSHLAFVQNPVTYAVLTDEEAKELTGRVVKHCHSPKLKFYERPEISEAAVFDGSEYMAGLVTGEEFGCVNFEPKN